MTPDEAVRRRSSRSSSLEQAQKELPWVTDRWNASPAHCSGLFWAIWFLCANCHIWVYRGERREESCQPLTHTPDSHTRHCFFVGFWYQHEAKATELSALPVSLQSGLSCWRSNIWNKSQHRGLHPKHCQLPPAEPCHLSFTQLETLGLSFLLKQSLNRYYKAT